MSCSVCHLHLMLFYVEMYERNKMMMMMKVPAENVKFVHITKYAKISTFPPKRMTRLIRGHNFELYWYNCNFFQADFRGKLSVYFFKSRSRLRCYLLLCDVFIFRITTNCRLMFMHIRLICAPIKFHSDWFGGTE